MDRDGVNALMTAANWTAGLHPISEPHQKTPSTAPSVFASV